MRGDEKPFGESLKVLLGLVVAVLFTRIKKDDKMQKLFQSIMLLLWISVNGILVNLKPSTVAPFQQEANHRETMSLYVLPSVTKL